MDWQDDEWLNKPRSTTFRAKGNLFFPLFICLTHFARELIITGIRGRTPSRQRSLQPTGSSVVDSLKIAQPRLTSCTARKRPQSEPL